MFNSIFNRSCKAVCLLVASMVLTTFVAGQDVRSDVGEGLEGQVLTQYFEKSGVAVSEAAMVPVLTITPITWGVVGLDSNNVTTGPNLFPVGARICNTGTTAATNVV